MTVADALRKCRSSSSYNLTEQFTGLKRRFQDVVIRWIPSHSKIVGNEMADKLAKIALRSLPAVVTTNFDPSTRGEIRYTHASLKRLVTERINSEIDLWWLKNKPSLYWTSK